MSVNWKQRERFIKETFMKGTNGRAVSQETSFHERAAEDAQILHGSTALSSRLLFVATGELYENNSR